MRKIMIRPAEIYNCWETDDACIIETTKGKKWVCEKYFVSDEDCQKWNTIRFIQSHQKQEFIELHLKGKGD